MNLYPAVSDLARACGLSLQGPGDRQIRDISIDSRSVSVSEGLLFIALRGEQHDGHYFIPELYQRGVRIFLVEELPGEGSCPEASFLLAPDSLQAFHRLAAWRRSEYSGQLLAITGSNGKTIVKEWLHQVLGRDYKVYRSPKSYNSQVGVPLSIWGLAPEHELAIMEAGISMPGEMSRLEAMLKPETGLFTHAGTAHQEFFSSMEEKLEEKLRLFHACKKVFCSADSMPEGRSLAERIAAIGPRIVSWSLENRKADYQFSKEEEGEDGCLVRWTNSGSGTQLFKLPFSDRASVENALQVICFALDYGMDPMVLAERAAKLEPVSMRLQILQGQRGSSLINDSYNSDLAGLQAALDVLTRHDKKLPRVLVLSDLYQSGIPGEALYRRVAELLDQRQIAVFAGVGKELCAHRSLFSAGSLFYRDTADFLKHFDREKLRDSVVLLKGSRSFGFEQVARELQEKVHATRIEIDLNALVENLNIYRSRLESGVRLMAMVKAFSYGAGSLEIARILQFHRVDYLVVAYIDEGVELRKGGIYLPIMVMNPDPDAFETLIDHRLEPELYSRTILDKFRVFLRQKGLISYPVHLKLDTGMHRLGFSEGDEAFILDSLRNNELKLKSIFTHLAASDEAEHDAFSRAQLELFESLSGRIMEGCDTLVLRHALNSAGIERFPEHQYEMVRLGLGLYGPGSLSGLKEISTLKTVVSQVKAVKEGSSIGYSRADTVEEPGRIATIALGYADGFPRSLGQGKGQVYIRGRAFKTIGKICMDMCMIDVSGSDVAEGDEVEVFGPEHSVKLLARAAGTIPYDILSSLSARIKRVYIQDGP